MIYINGASVCPSWRQRNRSQLSVFLLVPDSTTHQLSKGILEHSLGILDVDKNQDDVGKSSGEITVHYKRSKQNGTAIGGFC